MHSLIKLKSAIKNEIEVVLRLSSNMIGYDETNLPYKLLLTNRQVANLHKAFANKSLTNIMLSKTQLSKMVQLGGFLGRLLGPLLKTGLPLMKNIIKPLPQSVLTQLGLTVAALAANTGIHKKFLESDRRLSSSSASPHHPSDSVSHNNTILIISNDEMEDIIKIVKSHEDSGFLLKGFSETI